MDNLSATLKIILDKAGIKTELAAIQNIINKYPLKLTTDLQTTSLQKQIKSVSKEIAFDFNKTFGTELKANDVINAFNSVIKETTTNTSKLATEVEKLDTDMKNTGSPELTWMDKLKKSLDSFKTLTSVTTLITKTIKYVKKMTDEVYEIDTAMTSLYKITDVTDNKYNAFLTNTASKAKELGRSISSLITQSSEWVKLGYNIEDSAKLAEYSTIYSNTGEIDDSKAISDLAATMKAFNIAAEDSITIVDSLNKLGNEFATSSGDLGEGLKNSASAMAMAGTDINKTLALLTGGAEITQSASELGNVLKIGAMRIRGMKGALEELGEETDGLESISKIQTHIMKLTKGQVNIMNDVDPTKYKDYYEILYQISQIYDELTQSEQANLLETLFGKEKGDQGAALIQAFQSGQTQKAYKATLNSDGSAMAEYEIWLESIEAKTKQFQAAFQSLSLNVINSDFLKGLLDTGTGLISILDTIIDKTGIIIPLLSGIGITAFVKNFG